MIRPPANVAPFHEILGEEDTVAFLLEFGGAELYLSENPRRSALAQRFGVDRAAAIARACDTLSQRIPTAKPYIAAVLARRGLSTAQIARTLHVADWTVRRWRHTGGRARPPDPRQSTMF